MENLKFILFVLFCLLLLVIWEAWQKDYGPKPETAAALQDKSTPTGKMPEDIPDTASSLAESGSTEMDETPTTADAPPTGQRITVVTDVLKLEIDTYGGDMRILELLEYPISQEDPSVPFRLLTDVPPNLFVSQSGLLSGAGTAPNHQSLFTAEANEYRLQPEQDSLQVVLSWSDGAGIEVTKTYLFRRGQYLVELEQKVMNRSGRLWQGRQYAQLQRKDVEDENKSMFIRTYTGGVIYNEEDKYEKISFEDMAEDNLNLDAKGGWSAIIQHYFLAAWIPPADEINHYYTKALPNDRYIIGTQSEQKEVAAGEDKIFKARFFAGPKLQHRLEKIAPGLELTVDYGWLTVVGKPIFWLLEKFHSLTGNWGWAIMCVTLVIKLLFFKLSEASYRSMAKMRRLQPRLQTLRERYGDDKQRMNMEMMNMYRTEKVNPLGGCLPILVQIPVFISLYWVLIESVELRQAPFILWITDLSAKDPYFVLPVLMALSMYIQQRLNPTPIDPVQEKVMKMFPLVFGVFFMFFPAGLVLYWVVNNTLSIAQQWYITRQIEAADKTA
jgi:YidC/Oxa1 family membrane protein insertase